MTENGKIAVVEVERVGALDYPAAVSISTADFGIPDPELDGKIAAKINDIVKGMFPDDVREWELFYTNHQGDFTQATIIAKPATEESAQMRFVLYHSGDGEPEEPESFEPVVAAV